MKTLQLNQKQQKRLLSLCKEFFPEYKTIRQCEEWNLEEYIEFYEDVEKEPHYKLKYRPDLWIHWYQLCLTELPKRILDKRTSDELERKTFLNLIRQLLIDGRHPVDYLWEFVKVCKKDKVL